MSRQGNCQDVADPVPCARAGQGNRLRRELECALRVQPHQPGAAQAGEDMGNLGRAGLGKAGDLPEVLTGGTDGGHAAQGA